MTTYEAKLPFSKSRLEELTPPSSGRDTYWDTKVPGLLIRVSQTGIKSFGFYKRIKGGEPHRETFGRFPQISVEQARDRAKILNAEIANGANPTQVRRALRAELTAQALFEMYGERHGAHKKSWKDDQQRWRDYLAPAIGKRKLSQIHREDIANAIHRLATDGKAAGTQRQVRALASSIFSKALEWGLIDKNPASDIKISGKSEKRSRFLLPAEMPRFLDTLQQEPNEIMRDAILMSLLMGTRKGNTIAMKWSDIDLEDAIWHLPKTKNGEPQQVVLVPEAVEILKNRLENRKTGDEFVFPGKGETKHVINIWKPLQRILDADELAQLEAQIRSCGKDFTWPQPRPASTSKHSRRLESREQALNRARQLAAELKLDTTRCRIRDFHFHDLRRTLGSWQARNGSSLPVIGKSLNHKSLQATSIYARLDIDPVRKSVTDATQAILATTAKSDGIKLADFFGITVSMRQPREAAPPCLLVTYQNQNADIDLTGAVLAGKLPERVLGLVHEWIMEQRKVLHDNTERLAAGLPLLPVAPLV